MGEEDFDSKIKYSGQSFGTIFDSEFQDVAIPAISNDLNNDGFDDDIIFKSSSLEFSLGKADGSFYYVPQTVSGTEFADLNGDGFQDIITVSGGFISIKYQQTETAAVTESAPEPAPDPTPPPSPSDSSELPYLYLLDAEFPGAEILALKIDDESGEAEFKVLFDGEKIEGLINSDLSIAEIYD